MKVSRVGCAHSKKELAVKHILAILVVALLFGQTPVFAETKEIVAEGTYNMGDGETPTVAESRALLQAKRTAVEEAGTYVESYSKTRNFKLTVDEIQVLASGIMEVEVVEKKRTVVGDGINFWIKIKARVSTDKMEEMAKRVKEKSVVADYKNIQAAYDKSQKEIEELKKQLERATGEKKKQVAANITDEERLFQAIQLVEKGRKDSVDAVMSLPVFRKAYPEYNDLSDEDLAQRIHRKYYPYMEYIEFKNKFISSSIQEQVIINKSNEAIETYSKAITLVPNLAIAYYLRGIIYRNRGEFVKAGTDFQKACDLGNESGCELLQNFQ